MKKGIAVSAFWMLVLVVPPTVLALAAVAYVDLHFSLIAQTISNFEHSISSNGAGLVSELSARFPEIWGMAIGMIILLTIYIFGRQPAQSTDQNKK
jgi:hypothetical protein